MSSTDEKQDESQKRRFYRIDDKVLLTVEEFDMSKIEGEEKSTLTQLKQQKMQGKKSKNWAQNLRLPISTIAKKSRDLASIIGVLIERIQELEAQLEEHTDGAHSPQTVNISGSGMAFGWHEEMAVGTDLLLDIVLQPTQEQVICFAKAVKSWPNKEAETNNNAKAFMVAVDYSFILLGDQDLLVNHISKKQMKMMRGS